MRVAGLDLSLTGAAACVIPADWNCDWRAVTTTRVGHGLPKDASDADQLGRLVRLRAEVIDFLAKQRATHVFVEQYAFGAKSRAHALGELGGVVKVECLELGLPVRSVPASEARKLFLGKLPKADQKVKTQLAVYAAGAPKTWGGDCCDAWIVANFGLAELGERSAMVLAA